MRARPSFRILRGMGVDAGDFDGDGWLDLVVTNLDFETNTFYRNLGGKFFEDVTVKRLPLWIFGWSTRISSARFVHPEGISPL